MVSGRHEVRSRAAAVGAGLLVFASCGWSCAVFAGGAPKAPAPARIKGRLAPLPPGQVAVSAHGAFATGECGLCHDGGDAKAPGPVTRKGTELCVDCHEDFKDLGKRRARHKPAVDDCTSCHNPHNSRQPALLLEEATSLCLGCHEKVRDIVKNAKVKHGALDAERGCLTCHDPHASNIDQLITRLPFDLCIQCHGKDDVLDHRGLKLTNIKRLLDENKVWHAPVESKDCSACHTPHGGENFRLLVSAYPPEFYAPFDERTYGLCFDCHDRAIVTARETTALTLFRDGSKNLHYLHVNRKDKGRTCRACHEVHASNQPHNIREGVPYGSKGWVLKINYSKTATGGRCDKTCHAVREYNNVVAKAPSTAQTGK